MTDRELMHQALAALAGYRRELNEHQPCDAERALEERLARPKSEQVAWHEPGAYSNVTVYKQWAEENGWLPLYAAPPQREWQGLTDKEHAQIAIDAGCASADWVFYGAAVERALREKNG